MTKTVTAGPTVHRHGRLMVLVMLLMLLLMKLKTLMVNFVTGVMR